MRYPNVTMSELDATMVKWLTGSIDKDGKKNRREEQKAARMRVKIDRILTTHTVTDLMLFLGVCGAEINKSDIPKLKTMSLLDVYFLTVKCHGVCDVDNISKTM